MSEHEIGNNISPIPTTDVDSVARLRIGIGHAADRVDQHLRNVEYQAEQLDEARAEYLRCRDRLRGGLAILAHATQEAADGLNLLAAHSEDMFVVSEAEKRFARADVYLDLRPRDRQRMLRSIVKLAEELQAAARAALAEE